jgi:molecular chaperone GrpE
MTLEETNEEDIEVTGEEILEEDAPLTEVEQLRFDLEQAVGARQRALADFANFQRRATENETKSRERGIAQVVRNLVPVLDQFEMALDQEGASTDSILEGISLVREELMRALGKNGVEAITPQINDEFDANRHEAMLQHATDGVEAGHVSLIVKSGWTMGSLVLRPAQVGIAPSESGD